MAPCSFGVSFTIVEFMIFLLFAILTIETFNCDGLYPQYFICENDSCVIDSNVSAACHVKKNIICDGERNITKYIPCKYCWQLPETLLKCGFKTQCKPTSRPQIGYCEALSNVECLGPRSFSVQLYCRVVGEYSKRKAIILSLLFGGFGLDRFYLGYIFVGTVKLFTLGGFGIWSIIDVFLIYYDSLKPVDGSFYRDKFLT